MIFPTNPGDSFTYRRETYWVIESTRSYVLAETASGQRKRFARA